MHKGLGFVFVGAILAACSSGPDGSSHADGGASVHPLSCDLFTGNNCYATTVASAKACLPPASARGTFNADQSVCTYADGTTVTFPTGQAFPPSMADFVFIVEKGRSTCLSLKKSGSTTTITVPAGTVVENDANYGFTCPDGTEYSETAGDEASACDAGGSLPSPTLTVAPGVELDVSLANLDPTAPGHDLLVFQCGQ